MNAKNGRVIKHQALCGAEAVKVTTQYLPWCHSVIDKYKPTTVKPSEEACARCPRVHGQEKISNCVWWGKPDNLGWECGWGGWDRESHGPSRRGTSMHGGKKRSGGGL